jgi:hypothetical protein
MSPRTSNSTGWVGWVYFAGILLLVKAFFQAFLGIVALTRDDFYVVAENQLAVFNFTAWGWLHLILAVVLLTAAFSLFVGGLWGRVIGTVVVSLSLLANLVFLPAYPIWGLAALVIDALILYAILVHGDEA